jgi:Glycosyl hydrolase 36 superfamily, catalytic domain
MDRRSFLSGVAMTTAAYKIDHRFPAWLDDKAELSATNAAGKAGASAYGSGYFGRWMDDEFGLPAFHYTCDQIHDAKAATTVNPGILSATEHIHQVGNDRLVAVVSNYGYVRVRQDEGAPKFLNDYAPERGCFGAGIGYLTDGKSMLSTFYSGESEGFDRIFGVGYLRKKVSAHGYSADQVIFAPFGDDPVLVSQVTISNHTSAAADLRWLEYWGCQVYQFSFRSFIESFAGKSMCDLRRDFGAQFAHHLRAVEGSSGLLESQEFLGRQPAEEAQWKAMIAFLEKTPNPFLAPPDKNVPADASFDDLNPPSTFLISLDAAADGMSADGKAFFGSGSAAHPEGLGRPLDGNLGETGPASALLLERKFSLNPGGSKTLAFLYGYLPQGADLSSLVSKYRASRATAWRDSSLHWIKKGLRFSTEKEPWVEREVTWNHYYLRSGLTYDGFFRQHILSQASVYQYVMGFQGAARDPLQHVMPFLFSDPEIVKEILLYTLKEVRPDGSLPYGLVGNGMIMPTTSDNASDLPMWLLWAVSDYVFATRDKAFLEESVTTVYGAGAGTESVGNLLARCHRHLVKDVKTGEHGLMRMLHDDWNDALVMGWVPQKDLAECLEKGESVLNSAMASYVFDRYAQLLAYMGGDRDTLSEIRRQAEDHRKAVRQQWTGKWFRRAWLGPALGWLGEKGMWLEPQPWAIIGGATSAEQTRTLIQSLDEELRRTSPIGCAQLSKSPDMIAQDTLKMEPGTSIDGGVWPSLNATLIWALAAVNGEMAWDEWKKNSFARHAEVYPAIWYGTWSGPDVLNSASSEHPGETTGGAPFGWTDFPVLNMHTHACPLFSLVKLIGLNLTAAGLTLSPGLPLPSYRFDSPLLGLTKSLQGYEGWYNPSVRGTWSIRLKLPAEEVARLRDVKVNGASVSHARAADGTLVLEGSGGGGSPLRWSVRHE